jgi:hypothetical protein
MEFNKVKNHLELLDNKIHLYEQLEKNSEGKSRILKKCNAFGLKMKQWTK